MLEEGKTYISQCGKCTHETCIHRSGHLFPMLISDEMDPHDPYVAFTERNLPMDAKFKVIKVTCKTTNNFKVGDKVYVDPGGDSRAFTNHIRATVTEVSTNGWGYHLRAFQQDLPGIYMFNVWDAELSPRTSKKNKPLSPRHNYVGFKGRLL